ncbi:proline-rich protein PRCC isoform X2 [Homalodisca vitripennis]|nr:proline-rich protein PRCC isoform X2 [Homalodisca vitripennis]XP_046661806.1 proline-rich protein PRCC isoform X2 [Homalodisca vitripennis]XP_046661807.1 proline-rich protein PRCC isoform X2 [Homalodisca vitripennis]XP_046661808.1 proline-rich protein PRCC isoform X2 [Homalodisca vitripennis]XP_046661809.1 proline-rich protein PRCC isoform X2 [Homalodisca vitripennis]XP_046661811.1 proline-rich protein PRCC isoform X2 [Homalodisca vitripennis]XP_046661812.1 proline-rich protein PRCC isofor
MSLGLVSYDDSEESDNEVDTDDVQEKQIATKPPNNETSTSAVISKVISDEEFNFSEYHHKSNQESKHADGLDKKTNLAIPEPKFSLLNTDIDIKYLTSVNKRNGPVKITIPSLNEIEEEEEQPSKKKLKPSQKGSGLFALLPNPKTNLVPQSVARPSNNQKAANKKPTPSAVKNTKPLTKPQVVNKQSLINYEDSGDEDEPSGSVDFFSLDSREDVTPAPVDIDIPLPQDSQPLSDTPLKDQSDKASSLNHAFQTQSWATPSHSEHSSSDRLSADQYTTSDFVTFNNKDLELDEEAMQQLCGRRDRLRMQAQDVSVIDVSGDAIMPDSREWLTKQLTEETNHRPSHKRKDGPTTQQKRKHQITYLAFQAKENELELKNQWANNRMSRKQTQAKYGF